MLEAWISYSLRGNPNDFVVDSYTTLCLRYEDSQCARGDSFELEARNRVSQELSGRTLDSIVFITNRHSNHWMLWVADMKQGSQRCLYLYDCNKWETNSADKAAWNRECAIVVRVMDDILPQSGPWTAKRVTHLPPDESQRSASNPEPYQCGPHVVAYAEQLGRRPKWPLACAAGLKWAILNRVAELRVAIIDEAIRTFDGTEV